MAQHEAKRIPTRDEYCAEMRRQGDGYHAALRGEFDKNKPGDWVHTETIRAHTGMSYKEIAHSCGLRLQTKRTRASPELDAPPERIGPGLNRAALDATENIGCREIWRPVMAWDHMTACYRPTGMWESLWQIGPFPKPRER